MPSSNGDDFQDNSQETTEERPEVEVELEAGPRAERPNFLTATRFVDFDLPPEILEGLDKAGFEYCTPIQAQAIPVAMKGDDIAGQAQTGTGKTTAFLVPMLNRLLNNKPIEPDVPRAIIVTPTRELALQIHEDATVLAGATGLRQALVIGGMEYREQAELLASGPEIVICTPGRIIDYLQQGVFKTKGIEVAVVDEADRLLDMGFIKDLKYLLGKLPPFTKRQTMLFSATLDERVLELTYQYMNPPQYITAEPDTATKVNITQELYHVGREEKLSLLMGLLRREEHQRVIIFVNTKSGVEWLSKKLTLNGFQAEGITGDLPQPKRLKLMEAFKENRLQILVATDVASRGIHVDDVSHVYNYDLPQDAENYVHRIGRTARAGHAGKAVSFGCEDYVFHLEAIENLLGEKIPVFWAEAEWFQEDQGGEVRLKERKNDRRKSAGSPAKAGRSEGGERRPSSRGPAKSQRPGGIFGLSPRISGDGVEDSRQMLAWGEAEEVKIIPVEEAEALGEETSAGNASEASASGERENGRRRKRRRGRRGRGAEALTGEQAPQAEAISKDKAELAQSEKKAESAPSEEKEQRKKKKPAPKSRKSPAQSNAESAAASYAAQPPVMEESPKTEQAEPVRSSAQVEEPAEKKPRRSSKKSTGSKQTEPKAARAADEAVQPAGLAESGPEKTEVKKPKRTSKKATATTADEKAPKAAAAVAEEGQLKKAPPRTSKKTSAATSGEKEAAGTKPAKAASVKDLNDAGKAKKTARAKKDDGAVQAEAPKSRQVKKIEEPAEKPKKPAAKRATKKTEAAGENKSAPKSKPSKKADPEA